MKYTPQTAAGIGSPVGTMHLGIAVRNVSLAVMLHDWLLTKHRRVLTKIFYVIGTASTAILTRCSYSYDAMTSLSNRTLCYQKPRLTLSCFFRGVVRALVSTSSSANYA